jgi:predicted nucleotidyltransferase
MPARTVLDLTPDERTQYVVAARRRETVSSGATGDPTEREALLARCDAAAALLKARFGARRVILFGSLVHAAWDTAASDVDFGAEGLSAEAYWKAWGALEDVFPERGVDLVDLDTARDSLRQAIRRGGKEL